MDTPQPTQLIPPPLEEMNSIWKWVIQTAYNQGFPLVLLLLATFLQQQQIHQLSDKVDRCNEARIGDLKASNKTQNSTAPQ